MRLPPVHITTVLDHEALRALYGDARVFSWAGPADEPRFSVSAFGNESGPHWHYVVLGTRDVIGCELSFRLAAGSIEDISSAPRWPAVLLQQLAKLAQRSGRLPNIGGYLCFEAPLDPHGEVRCVALVGDPQLPDTLQAVGLHEDELPLMSEDDYPRLLGALEERAPLWVTEPRRAPIRLD